MCRCGSRSLLSLAYDARFDLVGDDLGGRSLGAVAVGPLAIGKVTYDKYLTALLDEPLRSVGKVLPCNDIMPSRVIDFPSVLGGVLSSCAEAECCYFASALCGADLGVLTGSSREIDSVYAHNLKILLMSFYRDADGILFHLYPPAVLYLG